MVTPAGAHPRSFIYLFSCTDPRAALLSTRPGGERGEVGLRLTRPEPPRSSGPRRGRGLRASPSSLPAGLSPEKLGTSPWASSSIPALRVWWAVCGGLCALCLGAPVFSGARFYFSQTYRVYQSSVTFYLIVSPPPRRATGRSLLVRGGGCEFWGVGASHIIGPGSWDGLFVPWPGELGRGLGVADHGEAGSLGPPGTKGLTLSPPASSGEEGRAPGPDPSPGPAMTSLPPPFGVSAY